MKVLIDKDIYNICSRIKKFDKNYILIYDTDINKYKVYSSQINGVSETVCNKKLSYVCTLPFDELDTRTIKYLYDTRIENIEMIIKRLDEDNQKIEQQNQLKSSIRSLEIAENKLRKLTR